MPPPPSYCRLCLPALSPPSPRRLCLPRPPIAASTSPPSHRRLHASRAPRRRLCLPRPPIAASASPPSHRRLEEWKAEAADRQLEKLAEDFIKKKAKQAVRGGVQTSEVDKYLEKYRKDAESCVNAVEESVRASLGKRKNVAKPRPREDAKKLKIW
ncbi:hypothetical protein GUJ93_ZPchr0013g34603 [Zizania palustris]|uniref:Uncharacterized protein n=1 Tax=Zizania palustris TaxID=103762 RepID=A0A8J5WYM4_ZIZPA|nr:hypothetical protein GUJ93_ZPchr0013g34603 [Zizania palustris]